MKFVVSLLQKSDGSIVASCAGLPECSVEASSEAQAVEQIQALIRDTLQARQSKGQPIDFKLRELEIELPEPSEIEPTPPKRKRQSATKKIKASPVIVYTDGCSKGNPGPAGAGFHIRTEDGISLAEVSFPLGIATNNEAEYHALILAMERCIELGLKEATFYTDSQLMERQVNGRYQARNSQMAQFLAQVNRMKSHFERFKILSIPREMNTHADWLSNQALKKAARTQTELF